MLAYISGNKHYIKYFEEDSGSLTVLNMMEIYFCVLRDYGEEEAEKAYSANSSYMIEFDGGDVREAMKKRLSLRKVNKNLSYADAIGYAIALRLNVKFLTGDKEFEDLANVEYVK